MQIIEYFTAENKEHWLKEIEKCDWGAGQYLHQLLSENRLKTMVGETALVPMLVDGDELIAFCTFAPLDGIQPTDLSPWIGFVYTFPDYRGHHYAGALLDYAESIATVMEHKYIYISTNHIGLYEKYGYKFYKMLKDIQGKDSRVYRKALAVERAEQAMKKSRKAYYKSIVDQDRASVVICNLEHEIIYMNPAAINNYQKRGGEKLIGKSLLECHNQESREKIQQVVDWFEADDSHNIVYTFHNEKQNKDVYMVALRDEGELIGYYEKHEYRNAETMKFYDFW